MSSRISDSNSTSLKTVELADADLSTEKDNYFEENREMKTNKASSLLKEEISKEIETYMGNEERIRKWQQCQDESVLNTRLRSVSESSFKPNIYCSQSTIDTIDSK